MDKNTFRLGELFPADEEVQVCQPEPFNEELAQELETQAQEMLAQEQRLNSARDYRKLFTELTGESIDDGLETRFEILEQQFGKTMVQESVEYIAMVKTMWELKSFFSYLLKSLQGRYREYSDQFTNVTLEDRAIEKQDKYTRQQTLKHVREMKQW